MRKIIVFGMIAAIVSACSKGKEQYIAESRSLMQQELYEESLKVINEALEDYQSPVLYNLRGVSNFELGNFDRAIEDFNKALEIDTTDYKPFYNRGKAYYEKGEFHSALRDFSTAMDLNPAVEDIYVNHGNALFELGEYRNALDSYNFAIRLNPVTYLAHLNKARALIHLENFNDALVSLEKAVEIDSERGDAFYFMAYAQHLSGSDEGACLLYARSKDLGFHPGEDVLSAICQN